MNVMFRISFVMKTSSGSSSVKGFARLVVDLPFAPAIGMAVEQSAWNADRIVKQVTLGLEQPPTVHVYMGSEEFESEERYQSNLAMYESHGWTINA